VDLIGGPGMLETLRLLRPGATACNSGSLSDTWVIPDFEPIAMIPSARCSLVRTPSPYGRRRVILRSPLR